MSRDFTPMELYLADKQLHNTLRKSSIILKTDEGEKEAFPISEKVKERWPEITFLFYSMALEMSEANLVEAEKQALDEIERCIEKLEREEIVLTESDEMYPVQKWFVGSPDFYYRIRGDEEFLTWTKGFIEKKARELIRDTPQEWYGNSNKEITEVTDESLAVLLSESFQRAGVNISPEEILQASFEVGSGDHPIRDLDNAEKIMKGYYITDKEAENAFSGEGITHIAKIDSFGDKLYLSDFEAGQIATATGIRVIKSFPKIRDAAYMRKASGALYPDTPENRKAISTYLRKNYGDQYGDYGFFDAGSAPQIGPRVRVPDMVDSLFMLGLTDMEVAAALTRIVRQLRELGKNAKADAIRDLRDELFPDYWRTLPEFSPRITQPQEPPRRKKRPQGSGGRSI